MERSSPIVFTRPEVQSDVLVFTDEDIRESMSNNPLPHPDADIYPDARGRISYEDDTPTPRVTIQPSGHDVNTPTPRVTIQTSGHAVSTHAPRVTVPVTNGHSDRALAIPAGTVVRVGKMVVLDGGRIASGARKGEMYRLEGLPQVLFYVVSVTRDRNSIKVNLIARPMCDAASRGETFIIPDDEVLIHVPAPEAYCPDAEFTVPVRYYWVQRPHYGAGPYRPAIRPHPPGPGPRPRPRPPGHGRGPRARPNPLLFPSGYVRPPRHRAAGVTAARSVSGMALRRQNRLERREKRRATKSQAQSGIKRV